MITNIDVGTQNTLWPNNEKIYYIVKELINKNSVAIKFNTEGPCAKSLGIYDFLEKMADLLGVPHENIEIHTHNQIENHPTFIVKKYPLAHSLPTVQNEIFYSPKQHEKNFSDDKFKKIACFVGRESWDRLWISSKVYKRYKEDSVQTYHYFPDEKAKLPGIDGINWNYGSIQDITDAADFLKMCPLMGPDTINRYPITVDSFLNIDSEYRRFFVEIACETYPIGNTFFPTEKIWRPIALKTPFIVNGPKHYLKNLKRLGFKTFSEWWSEEYDYSEGKNRIEKILQVIDYICNLSVSELNRLYKDMDAVLNHNKCHLYEVTENDFKRVFGYL